MGPSATAGALVIALDRWGRVLLKRGGSAAPAGRKPDPWAIPGGTVRALEPPDECAVRSFEAETGHLLDRLSLFRVYRRSAGLPGADVDVEHVYFDDPDLDPADLEYGEGEEFAYFGPDELRALDLVAPHRAILEEFLQGTAYRALFH